MPSLSATQALTYWETHQDMTIFQHHDGGYAVVAEHHVWRFMAAQWRQTSPEELDSKERD